MEDSGFTEHTVAGGGLSTPVMRQGGGEQIQQLEQATKSYLPTDRDTWLNLTVLPKLDKLSDAPELHLELKERYKFVKKLGEGASGEVELVLDLDILRLVALKRLRAEMKNTKAMLSFINEIRIVGHLEHPNIVPIHDVGRDSNEVYYFVMKYSPGETLMDIIAKLKAGHKKTHIDFPFEKRIKIFEEIMQAVEFAHFHGIIHRDIKPSNVIIGAHGEVTLMDWGIAKYLKDGHEKNKQNTLLEKFEQDIISFNNRTADEKMKIGEKEGTVIGTFTYMAPEQAAGKNSSHDERTDIYSLCAMLYEFVTLENYIELPMGDIKGMLRAVKNEIPRPAWSLKSAHQPQIPKEYSHFIMKGLEKDPNERHMSVPEMQDLLERIKNHDAPVQCMDTYAKRQIHTVVKFLESSPMAGLILMLLFVLLLIAGLTSFFTGINFASL